MRTPLKQSIMKVIHGMPQAHTWMTPRDPLLHPQILETLFLMSSMQPSTCDMKCLLWPHHHCHLLLVIFFARNTKVPTLLYNFLVWLLHGDFSKTSIIACTARQALLMSMRPATNHFVPKNAAHPCYLCVVMHYNCMLSVQTTKQLCGDQHFKVNMHHPVQMDMAE